MYFWTTRQGGGIMEDNIASTEGKITDLDGANARHKEVITAMRPKLAVMVGPLTTAMEMGTHAYVSHYLLGEVCLVVDTIAPLVDCINRNLTEWFRLMAEQDTRTRFAYKMLWILLAYLNACILASNTAAEGDPGACILVSFRYLINELDHGRYTERAIPKSLQDFLTVCTGQRAALASAVALAPPAPRTIDVDVRSGGVGGGGVIVPRGRRRNERDG